MTSEEKRIAIAEVCGLDQNKQDIPDFLNDLNAMAEVTRVDKNYVPVHNFNLADYVRELAILVRAEVDDDPDSGDFFLISNATAAQRAEAFGRVKSLWTD